MPVTKPLGPVTIGNVTFEHPLMNGAGVCKFAHQVPDLAKAAGSAVVLGSITPLARAGNEGNVFFAHDSYSLNSYGMPNAGLEQLLKDLPEITQLVHDAGKKLIVSIAGFNPAEYMLLAQICDRGGADMIELNLGCPNVWTEGGQKRISTFDPELVRQTIDRARRGVRRALIAAKLSVISDPLYRKEIAKVLTEMEIDAVTLVNTFPNAFAWDADFDKQAISVETGLAGMSGNALKPIGLGHVREFRALLPAHISIIGAGGVGTGEDLRDYLAAGADLVQTTTTVLNDGPRALSFILEEYANLQQ